MHRNSQKRIYLPGAAYFITTLTRGRYPYFTDEVLRRMMVDQIHFAQTKLDFSMYGYAIMPDHVHLLIQPGKACNYSKIMQFLKRHFTRNANYILGYDRISPEGAIGQSRLRGETIPSPEIFIALLRTYRAAYTVSHSDRSPHPPFRWHKSFHDHIIRDERDFRNHLRYISRQREKHGAPGCVWIVDA